MLFIHFVEELAFVILATAVKTLPYAVMAYMTYRLYRAYHGQKTGTIRVTALCLVILTIFFRVFPNP